MSTYSLPSEYRTLLNVWETEQAIKFVKDTFQNQLASALQLRRITAPLFVASGTGLNDDLNGVEAPVSFTLTHWGQKVEIVQSLAKWKRYSLWTHHIQPGMGIYTDMNALRPDEIPDPIHSIYVDQWDWEKVIEPTQRTVETLYQAVQDIYRALLRTEFLVCERYPVLERWLPENLFFITSEELLQRYPDKTPKEREKEITRTYGAVFIRGIGGKLSNGEPHDGRSPDYDDWSSPTPDGTYGLNGDILLWNPLLNDSFEISSMGIRVSAESLKNQLEIRHEEHRSHLLFHSLLLQGELPQTMGGGLGQSRLCQYLLHKCHIGEVQASIWDPHTEELCQQAGVFLM